MESTLPSTWLEDSPQRRPVRLSWLAVLALVWLIYELTAQAKLSVAIGCIKFGWDDFATALWLRRMDPDRARGRACFWCYAASALAKIALAGFAAIFIVIMLYSVLQPGRRGLPGEGFEGLTVALIGFGFYSLALFYGVTIAACSGKRIWISREVHRARRYGEFPPREGEDNRAGFLLFAAMLPPTLLLILFGPLVTLMVARTIGLPVVNPAGNPLVSVLASVGLIIGFMVLGVAFLFLLKDRILARVVARSPSACWTEGEPWPSC